MLLLQPFLFKIYWSIGTISRTIQHGFCISYEHLKLLHKYNIQQLVNGENVKRYYTTLNQFVFFSFFYLAWIVVLHSLWLSNSWNIGWNDDDVIVHYGWVSKTGLSHLQYKSIFFLFSNTLACKLNQIIFQKTHSFDFDNIKIIYLNKLLLFLQRLLVSYIKPISVVIYRTM